MRTTVFTAVVCLGLAASSAALAETEEQRYFAARDAAIARVGAAMDAYSAMPAGSLPAKPTAQDKAKAAATDKARAAAWEKASALNDAERAKLEQGMRELVGPVSIEGFEKDGKLNLEHLIKGDQGFGQLDGLLFTSADKKASVIVTTTGAFRRWLAEHKEWWGKNKNDMPQQPGIAVQQNAFYTQALRTDSAIVNLTELHVRKPLGSVFVYAMLGGRTQDAMPASADEVFIAVGRGGHVFIGQSKSFTPVGPISRCEGLRKDASSGQSDDKTRKSTETRYLKCFSSWARYQPNYADALNTAQQIIYNVAAH